MRIAVTGFGESGLNIELDAPNGVTFSPFVADDWYMFTLATDIVITKIIASVVNGAFIGLSALNNLVPYIVIATAEPDSKNFTFIPETYFETDPYLGGQNYAIHSKTVHGESNDINVTITKGTQVMICMGFKMPEGPSAAQALLMGFNGSILAQIV